MRYRPFENLEAAQLCYHASVGYYDTALNLVTECLDLDPKFKATYEGYQGFLEALHAKDIADFSARLRAYRRLGKTITSFRKYRHQVLNAVESPYSNGFLEGTIGRIKKTKNTAYGFRNWKNFIKRIKLQLQWLRAIRPTTVVA